MLDNCLYGAIKYSSINIGDEIQTIASTRFLPRIDELIHRELVNEYKSKENKKTKLIMNAWWMWQPENFPPSEDIDPLLISMYIRKEIRENFLTPQVREYLLKNGPVGCRDLSTLEWLKENNIPAYFSGCLTLTLKRNPNEVRNDYILCVDTPDEIVEEIRKRTNREVHTITRMLSPYYTSEQRLELAKQVLKLYHNAYCVVSPRLHVILPCLAMETPVFRIIPKEYENDPRYMGYEEFVNSATEEEFFNNSDVYNFDNPEPNPEKHLEIRNKLIDTCKKFTGYDSEESPVKSNQDSLLEMIKINSHSDEQIKRILHWASKKELRNAIAEKKRKINKHNYKLNKKIVVVGLQNDNIGDRIILDTCQYLIKKVQSNASIEVMNLFPPEEIMQKYKISPKKTYLMQALSFARWLNHSRKKDIKTYYENSLKDADMVVFAGGGLVKHTRENFWNAIYSIINYCEKHKTPVYFNAIGVEGYDKNNFYSQLLKYSLNKKCVKHFSTRDDFENLNKYIKNRDKISLVGDPALWASELYNKTSTKTDTIGIGLLRSGIFTDYRIDFSGDKILETYLGIIKELENKGYKWQLFCNGFDSDYEMGIDILTKLNLPIKEYLKPRPKNTQEFVDIVNSYKATISGRLHANIIAVSQNVPTVGLVWNDKLKLFGKLLGIENRFIDKEKFLDSKYIVEQLEEAMANGYNQAILQNLKNKTLKGIKNFIENKN